MLTQKWEGSLPSHLSSFTLTSGLSPGRAVGIENSMNCGDGISRRDCGSRVLP